MITMGRYIMGKSLLGVLLIVILTGCISTPSKTIATTTDAKEARVGVYVANSPSKLPLPTSGYDIYVIGEEHGIHEIHQLFLAYLKMLHDTNGLRDIVLEYPQYCEKECNAYITGMRRDVPPHYMYFAKIFEGIKAYNHILPEEERIRVHCPEPYASRPIIYDHLHTLKNAIGEDVESTKLPSLDEFMQWDKEKVITLIDNLIEKTENKDIINELKTAKASIQCLRGNFMIIREETIARNITYVLEKLKGAPVLALYGGAHTKKRELSGDRYPYNVEPRVPWVQQLLNKGISIYSTFATGLQGRGWNPGGIPIVLNKDPNLIVFPDDTTLGDIFDNNPTSSIVYIDLQHRANRYVRTLGGFICAPPDTLLCNVFDGLVVFRRVQPLKIEEKK